MLVSVFIISDRSNNIVLVKIIHYVINQLEVEWMVDVIYYIFVLVNYIYMKIEYIK